MGDFSIIGGDQTITIVHTFTLDFQLCLLVSHFKFNLTFVFYFIFIYQVTIECREANMDRLQKICLNNRLLNYKGYAKIPK